MFEGQVTDTEAAITYGLIVLTLIIHYLEKWTGWQIFNQLRVVCAALIFLQILHIGDKYIY